MTQTAAIVTGASSGIGAASAIRLAKDFTAIVLVARGGEGQARTAEAVRAAGAEPLILEVDLAAADAPDQVVAATLDRFGRIDALLNIAGAVVGQDLFQMSDALWDEGMSLKFHGARRLTIRAWDALKAAGGCVVFTSGNAAETPKPGAAAVGAINAAIEALAKAFAERGVVDGVQVNTVSPGAVMTGRRLAMLQKAAEARGVSLDAAKSQFLAGAGVARFREPSEIAELMAFLASPKARWLTGSVLRMDGGEVKSV